MIKVLLWDIDGTLLDFLAAEKESIRNAFHLENLGDLSDEQIRIYSKINVGWWERLERNEVTKKEVLVGRFADFLEAIGKERSLAEKVNGHYEDGLCEYIFFMGHSKETLEALKGKVIQCAVTNGVKRIQDAKMEKTGFGKIFEHVFISEVVGYEKPNIGFFEKIEETIGHYEKNEIMIVGDSLTSDMKLGENAGILTCFFNPKHKEINKPVRLDYMVDDLRQVIEIVNDPDCHKLP